MFIKFGGVLLNPNNIDFFERADSYPKTTNHGGQKDRILAHMGEDYRAEFFETREARDARFSELEAMLCDPKPAETARDELVDMPDGSAIRRSTITAIRIGDAKPADNYCAELHPRVIVDFVTGEHGNCAVFDCKSNDERDALARRLRSQVDGSAPAKQALLDSMQECADPAPQPKRKVTVYLASDVSMSAAEKVRDLLSWLAPHDPAFESANPFVDLIFRHALDGTCFSNVEFDLSPDKSTWIDHGGHDPAACARLHNAVVGIIGGKA